MKAELKRHPGLLTQTHKEVVSKVITGYFGLKKDHQEARLEYLKRRNIRLKKKIRKNDEEFKEKLIIRKSLEKCRWHGIDV